jgi:hypothetical protein
VTATAILDSLAKEFSAQPAQIQSVLEMTDAGLGAPFIGRFRRSLTGGLSESVIRRVQGRREELEELDRRRGTILRLLEKEPGLGEQELDVVRRCMERFELEDAFVPHRRPEPEDALAHFLRATSGAGALLAILGRRAPEVRHIRRWFRSIVEELETPRLLIGGWFAATAAGALFASRDNEPDFRYIEVGRES